jgi:hypothetical protein
MSDPHDDEPIRYMQRTRDWYLALGYGNPYRWAHFEDVPFRPLAKALSKSTVALITTATPQPSAIAIPPRYDAAAKFYRVYSGDTDRDHVVRNNHVAIDYRHATGEDSNAWFPLPLMREFASQGRFILARRFHGMPTNRSQRHTMETDCADLLARCREDGVDAAILVPNCPTCHQTMSLAARHLEVCGISTVIMGCAKDIVEHCGVPRFVFSDFPLGHGAGKPRDRASQELTLDLALRTLESAPAARTTVQSALRWSASPEWKLDYSNAERASPEDLAQARLEMDEIKATGKRIRESGG